MKKRACFFSISVTVSLCLFVVLAQVAGCRPSVQSNDYFRPLRFSPDGDSLATGDSQGNLVFWDVASGKKTTKLRREKSSLYGIAFFRDGKSLIAGDFQGRIEVWDLEKKKLTRSFPPGHPGLDALLLSPDERTLVTSAVSGSETIRIWDVSKTVLKRSVDAHEGHAVIGSISRDGKTLISTGSDGHIAFWDIESGKKRGDFKVSKYGVGFLAVSPDGKYVCADEKIWDLKTKKARCDLESPKGYRVRGAAYSPDGTFIAGAGLQNTDEGVVWIWNASTGKKMGSTTRLPGAATRIAISPDGKTVAAAGEFDSVVFFKVADIVN